MTKIKHYNYVRFCTILPIIWNDIVWPTQGYVQESVDKNTSSIVYNVS